GCVARFQIELEMSVGPILRSQLSGPRAMLRIRLNMVEGLICIGILSSALRMGEQRAKDP
ncbi:MAG TPA: hypothetical protein VD816_01890, partial [Ohtaekwangia sp.]|nr:hypothetical protein [Ohtaekwangia sp.]